MFGLKLLQPVAPGPLPCSMTTGWPSPAACRWIRPLGVSTNALVSVSDSDAIPRSFLTTSGRRRSGRRIHRRERPGQGARRHVADRVAWPQALLAPCGTPRWAGCWPGLEPRAAAVARCRVAALESASACDLRMPLAAGIRDGRGWRSPARARTPPPGARTGWRSRRETVLHLAHRHRDTGARGCGELLGASGSRSAPVLGQAAPRRGLHRLVGVGEQQLAGRAVAQRHRAAEDGHRTQRVRALHGEHADAVVLLRAT